MDYSKPEIKSMVSKKLVGVHTVMSLAQNKTAALWEFFRTHFNEVPNSISKEFISLQEYPSQYFQQFSPSLEFKKWACVEVDSYNNIPEGLDQLELQEGLYAVFLYKGLSQDAGQFYHYIFGTWLPQSKYVLDHRPHFEVLGKKYKNNDPSSEEEVWIPIREK